MIPKFLWLIAPPPHTHCLSDTLSVTVNLPPTLWTCPYTVQVTCLLQSTGPLHRPSYMSVTVNLPPTLSKSHVSYSEPAPLHCPSHMSVTVNLPPTLSKSHVCYSEPAPYTDQVTCLLQLTSPLHCPSHMSVTVNLPLTLSKSHVCYSEPAPYTVLSS